MPSVFCSKRPVPLPPLSYGPSRPPPSAISLQPMLLSQKPGQMFVQAGIKIQQGAGRSLQRLKDLAQQHDAELFFSHDPEIWPG